MNHILKKNNWGNKMRLIITIIFMACFLCQQSANAASLSADDFLPPVQATSPEAEKAAVTVQQPEAVKEESGIDGKSAVAAATAQDAVNAAVERIAQAGGCEQIKFPSGFGWVATGTAVYGVVPNPVANLTAQRQAYQIAYMNAKKNLAEALHGLSTKGQDELNSQFKTIISDTDTLSNMSEGFSESITEQVQGILRGYVVYNVKDEQAGDHGTVSVTIVATPKTMGKGQRVDASGATADSVQAGLNAVLTELSTGLMPPVGGKTISVPQTGELAFIGFGSAVVPTNPNAATQAKLVLNAQKMAQLRARSALAGIILGDNVSATSSLDSATQTISNQFAEAAKNDPTTGGNEQEIKKLDEQRNSFVSTQLSKEQITSLRSGVLPPGVTVKTFLNPEKTIAEAVAVYLPSVTANAKKAGTDMKNSQIVKDAASGAANGLGSLPPQGPSGQVMKDGDL